jgi:hypothetical protein
MTLTGALLSFCVNVCRIYRYIYFFYFGERHLLEHCCHFVLMFVGFIDIYIFFYFGE